MRIMIGLAAVPLKTALEYTREVKINKGKISFKKWNKDGIGVQVIRKFLPVGSKGYRYYMPINDRDIPKIKAAPVIVSTLAQIGYKVDDYIAGIAVAKDGKRRVKIGKLLAKHRPALLEYFVNDEKRQAYKDRYYVVFSCHPYDIIGMSTGRRWDKTSCMRIGIPENDYNDGAYCGAISNDIAEGTIVAYVIDSTEVDEKDISVLEEELHKGPISKEKMDTLRMLNERVRKTKNINAPKARLLIKPFKTEQGDILFRPETSVYGTAIPGFTQAVNRWLAKVNKNAADGVYHLASGLYDDGVGQSAIIANFDKIPDKLQFYKENYKAQPTIKYWLDADKRWLGPILEEAAHDKRDDPGEKLTYTLRNLPSNISTSFAASMVDNYLSIDDAKNILYAVAQNYASIPTIKAIIKKSDKLKAGIAEDFEYNEEDGYGSDFEWVMSSAVFYDSRWLLSLGSISSLNYRMLLRSLRQILLGKIKLPEGFDKPSSYRGTAVLQKLVYLAADRFLACSPFSLRRSGYKKSTLMNLRRITEAVDLSYQEGLVDIYTHILPGMFSSYTNTESYMIPLILSDKQWAINCADALALTSPTYVFKNKKLMQTLRGLRNKTVDEAVRDIFIECVQSIYVEDDELAEFFKDAPDALEYGKYIINKYGDSDSKVKELKEKLAFLM